MNFDLSFLTVTVQRNIDLFRPLQRITHQSTTQCIDIVNRASNIFRRPERFELWEIRVHLCGCFGAWGVLELHFHTVYR